MTTKLQHFLQNLLDTELSLKAGYLNIPAKGFSKIAEVDKEEISIVYAVGRGWAEVVTEVPTVEATGTPKIEIEIAKPYVGLTFEELQAEQAKKEADAKVVADEKEAALLAKEAEAEAKVDTSPIKEFFPEQDKVKEVEPEVAVKEPKAKKVK